MSRVGKLPVIIPSGVNVSIDPERNVSVSGTKGSLSQKLSERINAELQGDKLVLSRLNDEDKSRADHGLMRTLIYNMVKGVSEGFSKKLEVIGVGYRVQLQGDNSLKLNLGYSHEINYPLPEGISANVEQNIITISGIDKQRVGQVASEIRALRKPEPYKGKGIKYENEYIIRKSGKSGKEK